MPAGFLFLVRSQRLRLAKSFLQEGQEIRSFCFWFSKMLPPDLLALLLKALGKWLSVN